MRKSFFYLLFSLSIMAFLLYACDETPVTTDPTKAAYSGVIKDEQDNAVPNAIVEIAVPKGVVNTTTEDIVASDTTDEEGNFSFPELSIPLDKALLRISHSDFKNYENSFSDVIKDKDPKKIPVKMLHSDTCCGTVTFNIKKASDSTTAMNDVQIKLRKNGTLYRTSYTNSSGQLTWENVCLNSYGIRIAKDGYKVIEKEISITNCDSNYVFTYYLQQNESTPADTCCNNIIKIWAKDSSNTNLNGATVKIRKNGVQITYKVTENGEPVTFREVCKGTYSFLIIKEGYQSVEFSATVDCLDSLNITKIMASDTCCKGTVKIYVQDSTNSTALNGATVKLYKGGTLKQTASVANGYAQFGPYCEGTYGIDVIKDGYKHSEMSISIVCNETTSYTKKLLSESDTCCKGYIKVFVKDSSNNESLNGSTVKLWFGGALKTYKTVENGYVIFGPYCQGTYGISVLKDGFKSSEMNVTIPCNDTLEYTKKLLASTPDSCCTGKLYLTIKKADGTIITGATVQLKVDGVLKYSATSNNDGVASIDGICAPKTYNVRVVKDGYVVKEFTLTYTECNTKNESTTLTPSLCCTGILNLTVKNADGAIVSGATVELKVNGVLKFSATSNSNGIAAIDGICAPKTYNVRVVKDGYVVKEFNFTWAECNTKNETVTLERSTCCTAVLKFTVKNGDGAVLSGVSVKVRLNGTVTKEGTTNSEGYIAFEGLCAPKTYSILMTKDTYVNKEFSITYVECNTKNETVTMIK